MGPGDRATLPILRGLDARPGCVHPAPRDGAVLAALRRRIWRALLRVACATRRASGTILEPDDGTAGGYGWRELAAIAEAALGRRVRTIGVPRAPLALAAGLAERYGQPAARPPILSRGKVAELYHRDWVCDTAASAAMPAGGRGSASATAWSRRWLVSSGGLAR